MKIEAKINYPLTDQISVLYGITTFLMQSLTNANHSPFYSKLSDFGLRTKRTIGFHVLPPYIMSVGRTD